jgi:uncharacterized membrane protein (DUF485 family)
MLLALIIISAFQLFWMMAYLDPGSGSYIIQLIIAGFIGALFMLGVYWRRVKSYVKGLISRGQDKVSNE